MDRPRWPNQTRALEQTVAAIAAGEKRICVASPTGSGKTTIMTDTIHWAKEQGKAVVLYTHRRMLFDQTAGVLEKAGIDHGKRAAGYEQANLRDVQVAMIQTEASQVYAREARELHPADVVLIDEAHVNTGDTMKRIMADHIAAGASCVGYTATPLDIGDMYDKLIVAGTVSEMRACGALVAATTYAPDEPDLKHIRQYQVGEDLSEKDNAKAIMRPGIFGRVVAAWKRHNPHGLATILFAPGVKESIWFAEQFTAAGIRAGHIDGSDVWLDGEYHNSEPEVRAHLMNESYRGALPVICNRFVLREGIDAPWIQCGVFATVFGSLTSYIQSGGRLLRAFPGKQQAIAIDHGGNWWRHGSLNQDREWHLDWTNHRAVGERIERIREKKDAEPIVCPACGMVRKAGKACPACGHVAHAKSRMVVQVSGELKPVRGDIVKPRYTRKQHNTEELWTRMYHRMKRAGRTFRQAEALFCVENHYWPPRDLPLMPKESGDWFRKVGDVPRESLL